jgi:fructosamine-3-kinase
MKLNDIMTLPIKWSMPRNIRRLRRNAKYYLKDIVEKSRTSPVKSLAALPRGSLKALQGGMSSAVYELRHLGDHIVIGLKDTGAEATREAIRAWQKEGANVVNILRTGTISDRRTHTKVRYLISEGVKAENNSLAPNAYDYAHAHPDQAYKLGLLLGRELAKMHKAASTRSFGEYADVPGNKAQIKSWNKYLLGYINMHMQYLLKLGLSQAKIDQVIEIIKKERFPKKGFYIHGDFSLRNSLIESQKPLKIKIFDPNPLIGDPSWDQAILYNNLEFSLRKYEIKTRSRRIVLKYTIDRECLRGFKASYEKASGKQINQRKVFMSQLMQSTFLLQTEERKARTDKRDPQTDPEVRSRKEALIGFIEKIIYG